VTVMMSSDSAGSHMTGVLVVFVVMIQRELRLPLLLIHRKLGLSLLLLLTSLSDWEI
jgi:hypothetical protein